MTTLRSRRGVMLFKPETTPGSDAAPATTNAILVENPRLTFDQSLTETNEFSQSLDPRAPIVGGLRAALAFDTYIKGSGAAGTAPEFGDLFKVCGWEEVVTAAIPSEAASTGGASTVTLGASATTTAQAYRGMPIVLSGNPATASLAFITDYTASKIATLTRTYSPVLSSSTNYAIPANVLYRPTSDLSNIKAGSVYLYMDGLLYKLFGTRGNPVFNLTAGGPGRISWNLTGIYGGKSDAAVPAISGYDSTRPPIWRDPDGYSGVMMINRAEAALQQLTFDNGNQLVYPDNPNALEGFDPTEITARRMTGTINPLATLVATRDLMADFRAGTSRIINAAYGTVAGNRFALTMPACQPTGYQPGDRDGLMTEEVQFFAGGEDAGAFACFY